MKTHTYRPRPLRESTGQNRQAADIQREIDLMRNVHRNHNRNLNRKRMGTEMRFLMIYTLAGLATLLLVGAIFAFC